VGAIELILEPKPFLYIGPVVCQTAGIEQHHSVSDDPVILQMRIIREDTAFPARLPQVEKALQPDFDFVEAPRPRKIVDPDFEESSRLALSPRKPRAIQASLEPSPGSAGR
jgi:hypothetical protein